MPINKIKKYIAKKTGCDHSQVKLSPNSKFGDLTVECFDLAKQLKKRPAFARLRRATAGKPGEVAKSLANEIMPDDVIAECNAVGPYLNFKINYRNFSQDVLEGILEKQTKYGQHDFGAKQKIMLEFAHPNTHKSFHIGHLRNIITGEAIVRILENAGYKIIRANYQGDVGLHIAKCLWGVSLVIARKESAALGGRLTKQSRDTKTVPFNEIASSLTSFAPRNDSGRASFLSKAYVLGNKYYEQYKDAKAEIQELNKKIYDICLCRDVSLPRLYMNTDKKNHNLKQIYQQTRQWSLDYFDRIYKCLGVGFDRLYFESEVFERGKKIVLKNLKKGIFKKSQGAIIFQGEKYGLHNRVFINSKGDPTYEAKDMALAELQFKEYNPDKIIHIVSKEQTEYFKVLFKALKQVMPKSKGREVHLVYGWVSLKQGKMSSRTGKVILGEWLLDDVKKIISKKTKSPELAEKISLAAVKYSILKTGRQKDIVFDIKQSINLSGNSGPYLLYTYARIKSILRKHGKKVEMRRVEMLRRNVSTRTEKQLILKLSIFPEITAQAAAMYEPSLIAKYGFDLAKIFNDYYHKVQILKSKDSEKDFRLALIKAIAIVLQKSLALLGIETLESM